MTLTPNSVRTLLSLQGRRLIRHWQDWRRVERFAINRSSQDLPFLVREHRLPIYRTLPGVDRVLFDNKKVNLGLALGQLDGVLIPGGRLFSLWRLIGSPTARRGFREGLVLKRGLPSRGVGGGLCQLANALFWLALHSDLDVAERHHHSLDLFPDDHREVPFGTGATIVYNFKDLRFFNPTEATYQFRLRLTEDSLIAQLRSDIASAHRYVIREAEHAFLTKSDGLYRRNIIVREKLDHDDRRLSLTTLFSNLSKCRYTVQEAQ